MFSMQHTLLTTCYAYISRVCVFVTCVSSLSLSLSSCPLLLSSAGWLVIRWREVECDSVIIRADMCRWPRDVSACWDFWGIGHLTHSLFRPSFSSATNIPADICFPSSLQSVWCLLGLRVCESDLIFRSGSFITWVQSDSGAARCDAGSPAGVWRSRASLTPGLTDFIWHKQELLPSWEMCIHATNLKTNKENDFSPTVLSFCISSTSFQLVDWIWPGRPS